MSVRQAWERRLKLLRLLLQRGRISTRVAAQAAEAPREVALRDLKALGEHGVPLRHEGEGQDREWVLEEAWRTLGLQIGFEGRLSLLLGRELMESFLHETDLGEAFGRIDHHIELLTTAGSAPDRHLDRQFVYVAEPGKDYAEHRQILRDLIEAIVGGHRISFTYQHARPPRERVRVRAAAPYTLAVYKRGLYIIADKRGQPQIHAVERISELEPHRDQTFAYPWATEYDPRELLAGRFGLADDGSPLQRVVLRFTAEGRPYAAARRWMPDQRIVPRDDGGCDLVFEARGLELASRVLEYGPLVEVIEPPALRARVRELLTRALAPYDDGA